jgi:GntR family transcriptional regulator/MocR family aminotransferase
MDPLFEIDLELSARGARGATRHLYGQLKAAILDGRLAPGARLPATRKSAAFFGLSRNTVSEVYARLQIEGYLVARRGSGSYVAATLPAISSTTATNDEAATAHHLNAFWLRADVTAAMGFWRDSCEPPPSRSKSPPVDFRPALLDSRLFPFDVLRRVIAKRLRVLERKPASYKSPQGNQGNYHFREAISKHIALTRAVACRGDDVLVTSGAQQAFDLLARVLVTSGKTVVAVEDPGYPPMRVAFAAAGAHVVPVGVDDEGLIVEQIPPDAGVICLCPSHQFPLGVTMSKSRRKALVEFARAHGAVIIEDDYDGEFRYDGSPLEALRTLQAADVVFYVGTFSKCMLPALRLGFIVAPEWAMRTLVAAKNCLDWHCSTPIQLGVAAFISEGHLAQHVRKTREVYRQRRQLLLNFLQQELAAWLEPIPSLYGMHVAAVARVPLDPERAARALGGKNVKIHTFSRYYLGPQTTTGLIFGYGAVDSSDMSRGLGLIKNQLRADWANGRVSR